MKYERNCEIRFNPLISDVRFDPSDLKVWRGDEQLGYFDNFDLEFGYNFLPSQKVKASGSAVVLEATGKGDFTLVMYAPDTDPVTIAEVSFLPSALFES